MALQAVAANRKQFLNENPRATFNPDSVMVRKSTSRVIRTARVLKREDDLASGNGSNCLLRQTSVVLTARGK
jgi:hypothetical protein